MGGNGIYISIFIGMLCIATGFAVYMVKKMMNEQ